MIDMGIGEPTHCRKCKSFFVVTLAKSDQLIEAARDSLYSIGVQKWDELLYRRATCGMKRGPLLPTCTLKIVTHNSATPEAM